MRHSGIVMGEPANNTDYVVVDGENGVYHSLDTMGLHQMSYKDQTFHKKRADRIDEMYENDMRIDKIAKEAAERHE